MDVAPKILFDPRAGDVEDDASSTKQRSMISLAGSLLAEISFPKLALTWMLLVGFPGLLLGLAPLLVSAWVVSVSSKAADVLTDIVPLVLLVLLLAVGWLAARPMLRLAEASFWSLNALLVQPVYVLFREGLRHLAESLLPRGMTEARRAAFRAGIAAAAGLAVAAVGLGLAALAWPHSRWMGRLDSLPTLAWLAPAVVANGVVLVSAYFAGAGLVWGFADATMPQPRDLHDLAPPPERASPGRTWRVAHLSDLHAVGERYGFRVESGRAGPRGNGRMNAAFRRLAEIHATEPLDVVLISGDMTDAGRSAEWAEFFAALAPYPQLADLIVALPGNHDVNVVDRANPARMDLPTSPNKRLRQMRTLAALDLLQGTRPYVVDRTTGRLRGTLRDLLAPHAEAMAAFMDTGSRRRSKGLAGLWDAAFPMVLPPATPDGLAIAVLNSNAQTHFSFSNALGLISTDQARALRTAVGLYPRAHWIVALHHHVVEYPQPAKALSERIGTALINGSWFVRQLLPLAGRAVIMHGHRHVDWIGGCGGLLVVSAPSPVMESTGDTETHFHIHTLVAGTDGRLLLCRPERVSLSPEPRAGSIHADQ